MADALLSTGAIRSGLLDVHAWLELAGGLVEVVVDTSRHHTSPWMCGDESRWHDERSTGLGALHTELTRLLYSWCALESLARVDGLVRADGQVDLETVRRKLAATCDRHPLPEGYERVVTALRTAAAACHDLADLTRRLEPDDRHPLGVLGLQAGRYLRNRLAHGNLASQDPFDWEDPVAATVVVALTTQALLLSLTMLLGTVVAHDWDLTALRWDEDEEEYELGICVLLDVAHLDDEYAWKRLVAD